MTSPIVPGMQPTYQPPLATWNSNFENQWSQAERHHRELMALMAYQHLAVMAALEKLDKPQRAARALTTEVDLTNPLQVKTGRTYDLVRAVIKKAVHAPDKWMTGAEILAALRKHGWEPPSGMANPTQAITMHLKRMDDVLDRPRNKPKGRNNEFRLKETVTVVTS